MDESLLEKKCVPCKGGTPLPLNRVKRYLSQIEGWNYENSDGVDKISKEYKFESDKEAVDFFNRVAEIAIQEGHHPDVYWSYNKVRLVLYTHAIQGLHENDFVVAAKVDALLTSDTDI